MNAFPRRALATPRSRSPSPCPPAALLAGGRRAPGPRPVPGRGPHGRSPDPGREVPPDNSYIDFNVYSSRATRVELWIYKYPSGYQEVVRYVMTKNATTNVWSKAVSVSTLATSYGLTGTVYYGYRAWGPNWPFSSSWTKGTTVASSATSTPAATASTPTSCSWIPTPWRRAMIRRPRR